MHKEEGANEHIYNTAPRFPKRASGRYEAATVDVNKLIL